MKLSERARNLKQSEPRRIYDAAQKYHDVIDLTLGDPDLPPPANVRDAACRAIVAGRTRYSAHFIKQSHDLSITLQKLTSKI